MTQILQQVIFPDVVDSEVHPLYVDRRPDRVNIVDRTSVCVASGTIASFATYFNAFPASYWRHWTTVDRVELSIRCDGVGEVSMHGSDAAGSSYLIDTQNTVSGHVRFAVDLNSFDAGGWLWFEASATTELTITDARWQTDAVPVIQPQAALGITTFNKPGYCAKTLAVLADSNELFSVLDQIFVIDQGDQHPSDDPRFAAAAATLDGRLTVICQPNFGGSGGYARAMLETLDRSTANFVMLMDDDVEIEPESIRRAVVFGSFCKEPTIVGGHMFDLLDRTKLYAWAEVVDEEPFMWRTLDDEKMPVDFATNDLANTPWLHERKDSDYNGWWMSLIPRQAIESAGLPLPAFIKWDDAEYSLRARNHGIPTLSLPGVALWHVSWVGKDDLIDWQAYFHARNRTVAALLHSEAPRGGTLLSHSFRVDLKHFMSMQYYPVDLRHTALRAVLSGPEHMHLGLPTVLNSARLLAKNYSETQPVSGDVRGAPLTTREVEAQMPSGMSLRFFLLRSLVLQWLRRPRSRPKSDVAEVSMTAAQARWWRLARHDSAVVELAATGRQHVYQRDRAQFRELIVESVRLHRELRRRWPELVAQYRASPLTSEGQWRATLFARSADSNGEVGASGTSQV
ncbi:glycosyltransferase [Microbacterium sp. R86528]|uniref:glycosyltransferase n=1 Tax=Microbacterium sp. R86528 TaxID=3093864 RepID=UPI0037CA50A6